MNGNELKGVLSVMILAILAIYAGLNRILKARKIKDHPRAKTRSVAQGLTELQGFAWALRGSDLMSLKKEDVVFLRWELQESGVFDKSHQWTTKSIEDSTRPFLLLDDSGAALIDPQGSRLEMTPSIFAWEKLNISQQARLLPLGSGVSGYPPRGFRWLNKRFRILETRIPFGSPIYALGEFSTRGSELDRQVQALSGATDFLPRFAKAGHNRLEMNEDRDGKVDEEEFRRGCMGEALRTHSVHKAKGIEYEQMATSGFMRTSQNYELLLSDCHEEHLAHRFGSGNILTIVVGAFMLAWAISEFF